MLPKREKQPEKLPKHQNMRNAIVEIRVCAGAQTDSVQYTIYAQGVFEDIIKKPQSRKHATTVHSELLNYKT